MQRGLLADSMHWQKIKTQNHCSQLNVVYDPKPFVFAE